jgi:hypothetical protein
LEKYNDDRIVIIKNQTNVGVAAGNNQGIKNAIEDNCDELLIINNDVEFSNTLLQNLSQQLVAIKLQFGCAKNDVLSRNKSHLVVWNKI